MLVWVLVLWALVLGLWYKIVLYKCDSSKWERGMRYGKYFVRRVMSALIATPSLVMCGLVRRWKREEVGGRRVRGVVSVCRARWNIAMLVGAESLLVVIKGISKVYGLWLDCTATYRDSLASCIMLTFALTLAPSLTYGRPAGAHSISKPRCFAPSAINSLATVSVCALVLQ